MTITPNTATTADLREAHRRLTERGQRFLNKQAATANRIKIKAIEHALRERGEQQ